MQNSDLGIDLGTASVLVYVKNKGVVLKEPSVVAYDKDTNKIRAIGEEARLMIRKTPERISPKKILMYLRAYRQRQIKKCFPTFQLFDDFGIIVLFIIDTIVRYIHGIPNGKARRR